VCFTPSHQHAHDLLLLSQSISCGPSCPQLAILVSAPSMQAIQIRKPKQNLDGLLCCFPYQSKLSTRPRFKIQGLQRSRKVVFFVVSPFSLSGWKTGSPVRRAGTCVGSAFITSAEPIVEGGRCRALPGRLNARWIQLSHRCTPSCCPGAVSLSEGRLRELGLVS